MVEKPLVWVGSTLSDLRRFPDDARRRAGFELHAVQQGQKPSDWFFVARFDEAVYVLHAFEKKTQKTSKKDLDLGRARLADVLASRASAKRRKQ